MRPSSRRSDTNQARRIVRRVYDNVNLALWAIAAAMLIVLGVFGVPTPLAHHSRYEAQRAQAIEAEDEFYCRKWGMAAGSGRHSICMTDLEQFRHSVEKRVADEADY